MTQVRIDYQLSEHTGPYAYDERTDEKIRQMTAVFQHLLDMNFKNEDYLCIMEEDHLILDFENPSNAVLFKLSFVL